MHRLHIIFPLRLTAFTAVAALVLVSAVEAQGGLRGSAKPATPIEVQIVPRGEILRGVVGEFTVIATVLTASTDFSLDVELPPELALYSGDLHQRGRVDANTRFEFTFAVRVPAEGHPVITATARLRVGDAGLFTATAAYPIGNGAASTFVADTGVSTFRLGERVREYPLP